MADLRILGVAVRSQRIGYVFLIGENLQDWGIANITKKSAIDLAGFTQELVNDLNPSVIVTEDCSKGTRKGKRAQSLIGAVNNVANHNYLLDVSVPRPQTFSNKYEEAECLVKDHPELMGYLPDRSRRIFDFEPRNMVIFEALALAEAVRLGPPDRLAAAMG